MPRPARRARATAVLLATILGLLVAGAIAFALRGGEVQPVDTAAPERIAPTSSPSPRDPPAPEVTEADDPELAEPTEPTTTPTPAPSPLPGPPPEGIAEIAAQVAELRGLPLGDPVDARTVSSADLGSKFAELAFAELDPVEIADDQRLLAALRLVDPDVDLVAVVEALYREQILGLYVLEEEVLYIGGDDPAMSDFEQITAAHEVVHALQDRAFDLEAMLDLPDREADAGLALRALIEGDATIAQEVWSVTHQSEAARARAAEEAVRPPSAGYLSAPHYVRESISFPYREGTTFVSALHGRGGWEAVDAAFANPPTTTRHILHPDTYLAGEEAVEVTAAPAPGEGWEEGSVYTFGEFDLRHLLRPLGAQRGDGLAAGWRGGETRSWSRDDEAAVSLVLAYGSDHEADHACTASPEWYQAVTTTAQPAGDGALTGDSDAFAWTCEGLEVRWGIAPDPETARLLAAG